MDEQREDFVEPEIIKHDERLADVTLQVGYSDASTDDDFAAVN
jgi:hypothetical protein